MATCMFGTWGQLAPPGCQGSAGLAVEGDVPAAAPEPESPILRCSYYLLTASQMPGKSAK